jgi:hypothetical protein
MKNDKEKFKNDFKKKVYYFILELIKFIDKLPKGICEANIEKRNQHWS